MCHPYAYKEIEALEKNDIKNFDLYFFSHINHLISNLVRSVLLSITRGYFRKPFKKGIVARYERKIAWASATFALLADIALARFGGNLKRKEKINGRFGDVLSAMYIATSVLRKFRENGSPENEEALVEHAIKEQLCKAQSAIESLYQNLFGSVGRILFFPFAMWARFNAFTCPADDQLEHTLVKNFIKSGELRDSLTDGIFVSQDSNDNLGRIENAFILHEQTEPTAAKIKAAIKSKTLPKGRVEDLLEMAKSKSVISFEEYNNFKTAQAAILDAMQVDEYSLEEYKNI